MVITIITIIISHFVYNNLDAAKIITKTIYHKQDTTITINTHT